MVCSLNDILPPSKVAINAIEKMANDDFAHTHTVIQVPAKKQKIENLFYIPSDLFEAVDYSEMGVVKEQLNFIPKFIKGEKYSLKGVSCDGFEMSEKVYELVDTIDDFDGINIDSVIVKQISGDKEQIFTLSKIDCEYLGIEFENGLQLFPKWLNWERVKDKVEFNKKDLGTTPLSEIDNTVRHVLIKLEGFKDYSDGYVLTPSGKLIKEEQFVKSVRVINEEPIVYGNGCIIADKSKLDIDLVYPEGMLFNHGNFISSENNVYILIKLARKGYTNTLDGLYGVEKKYLNGFNPNERFLICWDELGAYTIEEYEAEKAEKERIKKERIAKEEAQRKKRIEQEEKRIKEKRKLVNSLVERMRNYDIKMPAFPRMEIFPNENGLSSLNLFADGLKAYFKEVDSSLDNLSREINRMSQTIDMSSHHRINGKSIFEILKL